MVSSCPWPRLFCILMGERDEAGVHGKVSAGLAQPLSCHSEVHGKAWASPALSIPSLLLANPGPWASLAPKPLSSIGQTPHFF